MSRQMGQNVKPEALLRTMRVIWATFLITISVFILIPYFSRPSADIVAQMRQENSVPLVVLAVFALSSVVASFVLKASFYRRAADEQQPALLQTGFIIALALCESAVIMGLAGLFLTWNDYAYAFFALGALGELLHFPRREQVMSAYFKPGM